MAAIPLLTICFPDYNDVRLYLSQLTRGGGGWNKSLFTGGFTKTVFVQISSDEVGYCRWGWWLQVLLEMSAHLVTKPCLQPFIRSELAPARSRSGRSGWTRHTDVSTRGCSFQIQTKSEMCFLLRSKGVGGRIWSLQSGGVGGGTGLSERALSFTLLQRIQPQWARAERGLWKFAAHTCSTEAF